MTKLSSVVRAIGAFVSAYRAYLALAGTAILIYAAVVAYVGRVEERGRLLERIEMAEARAHASRLRIDVLHDELLTAQLRQAETKVVYRDRIAAVKPVRITADSAELWDAVIARDLALAAADTALTACERTVEVCVAGQTARDALVADLEIQVKAQQEIPGRAPVPKRSTWQRIRGAVTWGGIGAAAGWLLGVVH